MYELSPPFFQSTESSSTQDTNIRQERLYFFQFPSPFPTFTSPFAQAEVPSEPPQEPSTANSTTGERKVTFAPDTKPPAPAAPPDKPTSEEKKVDGVIGQLEIYASGAVKMRLANGILMEVRTFPSFPNRNLTMLACDGQVTAATQPSFLQQAVHVDAENKRLHILGEVNRRFVVSPDVDTLLSAMELAERPVPEELEGLIAMDTS